MSGLNIKSQIDSTRIAFLLSAIFMGGCGSSSRAGSDPGVGDGNPTPVVFSDFEDFDPGQFPDELIDDRGEIEHDVPAALMEDRADAGVAQFVSGFRIQTFASIDRDAALQAEEAVQHWFANLSDEVRMEYDIPQRLPVYNQFKQPLYRVRVGDFTSRAEAARVMTAMARSFQRVFVVPDEVTVYR